MKEYFRVLKDCKLFSGIAEENFASLLECLGARVCSYNSKDTIMAEGQTARFIGLVLSGGVQIIQRDYYGNKSIVSSAAPSELFGEVFACAGVREIPISAVAAEDSEIMLIDCARTMKPCTSACDFHGKIIFNLMKNMAEKNIACHRKIQITSKRTTREKLMTYLVLEAKKAGSSSFEIPFDRRELADYLEVDRSGLSAEISKLRREEAIKCYKSKFVLLKPDRF